MRKIYKLYIGIMLSAIAVACSDKLDSDKSVSYTHLTLPTKLEV